MGGLAYATTDALAIFRAALGIVALINALSLVYEAPLWLLDRGVAPSRMLGRRLRTRLSLYLLLRASDQTTIYVLATHIVAVLALIVGLASPVAAATAWVTLVTLNARNPYILYGGDAILRTLLLLSTAMPLGEAVSLDRWLNGNDLGLGRVVHSNAVLWARLYVILVYAHAVLEKLRNEHWRSGDAIGLALRQLSIRRFGLPGFACRRWSLRVLTYASFAFEAVLAIGLLIPDAAEHAMLAGIVFHFTLNLVFTLQMFSWIMISALLLFIQATGVAPDAHESVSQFWGWAIGLPFLAIATFWPLLGHRAPARACRFVHFLWMGQRWNMFCAESPIAVSSVLHISILTAAGTPHHFAWQGPEALGPIGAGLRHRFTKFATNLVWQPDQSFVAGFADYACRASGLNRDAIVGVLLRWKREVAESDTAPLQSAPTMYIQHAYSDEGTMALLTEVLLSLEEERDARLIAILAIVAHLLFARRLPARQTCNHLKLLVRSWTISDPQLIEYAESALCLGELQGPSDTSAGDLNAELSACLAEIAQLACSVVHKRANPYVSDRAE